MSENNALISTPQPSPIFEWEVGNGAIRVYHLVKGIVTIAFDNGALNQVYGTRELQGTPHFDAVSLVFHAVYNYHTLIPEVNPFVQMLEEPDAMEKLAELLQRIWSGE